MKILSLSIRNLKGTVLRELIGLGKINWIIGRNESGKSTIKDAITFALYGVIDGTNRIDYAITKDASEVTVVLKFLHNNENTYIVERSKSRTGNSTVLKINGKSVMQEDIDTLMGSVSEFISAFGAGDFMKLENETKRNILLKYFNDKDSGTVYKSIVGDKLALKYPYGNKEEYKTLLKNMDERISRISVEKQFLNQKILEFDTVLKPEVQISIEQFETAYGKYKQYIANRPEPPVQENHDYEKNYEQYEHVIKEHEQQLADMLGDKPLSTQYKVADSHLADIEEKIKKMSANNKCPTCGRAMPKTSVKTIEALQEEAKEYSEQAKKSLKDYDNKVARWNEEVNQLRTLIELRKKELMNLKLSDQNENRDAQDQYRKDLEEFDKSIEQVHEQWRDFESRYNKERNDINAWETHKGEIDKFKEQVGKLNTELLGMNRDELETVVKAHGPMGVEYAMLQQINSSIEAKLPPDIKIVLSEKNKTNDGYKSVFLLTHNGIPYQWCSTGRKVYIDIQLCKLLSADGEYIKSMFIDNAETLTLAMGKLPNNQLFVCMAEDEDFNIQIEN